MSRYLESLGRNARGLYHTLRKNKSLKEIDDYMDRINRGGGSGVIDFAADMSGIPDLYTAVKQGAHIADDVFREGKEYGETGREGAFHRGLAGTALTLAPIPGLKAGARGVKSLGNMGKKLKPSDSIQIGAPVRGSKRHKLQENLKDNTFDKRAHKKMGKLIEDEKHLEKGRKAYGALRGKYADEGLQMPGKFSPGFMRGRKKAATNTLRAYDKWQNKLAKGPLRTRLEDASGDTAFRALRGKGDAGWTTMPGRPLGRLSDYAGGIPGLSPKWWAQSPMRSLKTLGKDTGRDFDSEYNPFYVEDRPDPSEGADVDGALEPYIDKGFEKVREAIEAANAEEGLEGLTGEIGGQGNETFTPAPGTFTVPAGEEGQPGTGRFVQTAEGPMWVPNDPNRPTREGPGPSDVVPTTLANPQRRGGSRRRRNEAELAEAAAEATGFNPHDKPMHVFNERGRLGDGVVNRDEIAEYERKRKAFRNSIDDMRMSDDRDMHMINVNRDRAARGLSPISEEDYRAATRADSEARHQEALKTPRNFSIDDLSPRQRHKLWAANKVSAENPITDPRHLAMQRAMEEGEEMADEWENRKPEPEPEFDFEPVDQGRDLTSQLTAARGQTLEGEQAIPKENVRITEIGDIPEPQMEMSTEEYNDMFRDDEEAAAASAAEEALLGFEMPEMLGENTLADLDSLRNELDRNPKMQALEGLDRLKNILPPEELDSVRSEEEEEEEEEPSELAPSGNVDTISDWADPLITTREKIFNSSGGGVMPLGEQDALWFRLINAARGTHEFGLDRVIAELPEPMRSNAAQILENEGVEAFLD